MTDKSKTLIDNIFTNGLNNIGGILKFDTSDHIPDIVPCQKRKLN